LANLARAAAETITGRSPSNEEWSDMLDKLPSGYQEALLEPV
jgi:hypothetical protein